MKKLLIGLFSIGLLFSITVMAMGAAAPQKSAAIHTAVVDTASPEGRAVLLSSGGSEKLPAVLFLGAGAALAGAAVAAMRKRNVRFR